jgi:hypothetical protein
MKCLIKVVLSSLMVAMRPQGRTEHHVYDAQDDRDDHDRDWRPTLAGEHERGFGLTDLLEHAVT